MNVSLVHTPALESSTLRATANRRGRLAALGAAGDIALADGGGRRDSRVGDRSRRVPSSRGEGERRGGEQTRERGHFCCRKKCTSEDTVVVDCWCWGILEN